MTNKQFLTKAQHALDLFERQEPRPESERRYGERDKPWFSFTMQALNKKSDLQQALSNLLCGSELDNEYAYQIMVEVLEAIAEIVPNDKEEFTSDMFDDVMSDYADSNTPIYNNEILNFVRSNPYMVDDAIATYGKGESLINDGQMAYYQSFLSMSYEVVRILENN